MTADRRGWSSGSCCAACGGAARYVVDDDPDVVAMAEAEGLPVRLADWVPRSRMLYDAQERDGLT